jgi:hypothetical protein
MNLAKSQDNQWVKSKAMICFIDRLAGIPIEKTAENLKLSPLTVRDLAVEASGKLKRSGYNLDEADRYQKALMPMALKGLSRHLGLGTKEILSKYMEGNGLWRKNIDITAQVINVDLAELLSIIDDESDKNPQLAELRNRVDGGFTVLEDSDGVDSDVNTSDTGHTTNGVVNGGVVVDKPLGVTTDGLKGGSERSEGSAPSTTDVGYIPKENKGLSLSKNSGDNADTTVIGSSMKVPCPKCNYENEFFPNEKGVFQWLPCRCGYNWDANWVPYEERQECDSCPTTPCVGRGPGSRCYFSNRSLSQEACLSTIPRRIFTDENGDKWIAKRMIGGGKDGLVHRDIDSINMVSDNGHMGEINNTQSKEGDNHAISTLEEESTRSGTEPNEGGKSVSELRTCSEGEHTCEQGQGCKGVETGEGVTHDPSILANMTAGEAKSLIDKHNKEREALHTQSNTHCIPDSTQKGEKDVQECISGCGVNNHSMDSFGVVGSLPNKELPQIEEGGQGDNPNRRDVVKRRRGRPMRRPYKWGKTRKNKFNKK